MIALSPPAEALRQWFYALKKAQADERKLSMPWTRKQVKLLLSQYSPLSSQQKTKMVGELHADPAMGHAKKGSKGLKKK